ncbi:MAG TPA: CRISPR-associated endonuclease Cas1, partial [Rhizomicrobium sp.]
TAKNRIPLVYDLMEPLRPVVARRILEFILSHAFTPGDFTINKWGGCRLNPQMARVIASQVSKIECRGLVKELITQIAPDKLNFEGVLEHRKAICIGNLHFYR